jgi:hypothetical protein
MFVANVIGLSNDFIYGSSNNLSFSSGSLSYLLLEIYLNELDWYLSQISGFLSFKKLFSLKDQYKDKDENSSGFKFLLNNYLPVKAKHLLNEGFELKSIYNQKNLTFKKYYLNNFPRFLVFEKSINYLRYIDQFLIGFIGSKVFSLFIYNKILNFVRANLHFDFDNTFFYQSNDKVINFLGFNIKFDKTIRRSGEVLSKRKYMLRLLYKIQFYKRKVSKDFSNRLNLELISHFNTISSDKVFQFKGKGNKIWMYIFQLEAVRSIGYGKLFLTSDKISTVSNNIFTEIKFKSILNYRIYLFSTYVFKAQFSLQKVVYNFSLSQNSFSFPFVRQLIIKFTPNKIDY